MERRTRRNARLRGYRFRVVPGENAATRLGALDEVFHDEPVDGVLHVVAWGHATPRRTAAPPARPSPPARSCWPPSSRTGRSRRTGSRSMAVRRDRPTWLVVAVTKADLFADDVDAAVHYYSPGSGTPFGDKLDELRALAGAPSCRSTCCRCAPGAATSVSAMPEKACASSSGASSCGCAAQRPRLMRPGRLALAVVTTTYVLALVWRPSSFPSRSRAHFDAAGRVDDWSSRGGILVFWAAVGLVVLVGIPALTRVLTVGDRTWVNMPRADEEDSGSRPSAAPSSPSGSRTTWRPSRATARCSSPPALTTWVGTTGRDAAPWRAFVIMVGAYVVLAAVWTVRCRGRTAAVADRVTA